MISLICTHCQTQLMIDDAFAGGVCRCQHCGTIQTVPARDAVAAGAAKAVQAPGRSLYRTQREGAVGREVAATDSTGGSASLEQLADVVASSGLGGSGLGGSGLAGSGLSSLRGKRKSSVIAPAGLANSTRSRTPLIIGLATALLIAIGLCVWLAMRSGSTPSPSADGTPAVSNPSGSATGTAAGSAAAPTVAGGDNASPAVAASSPQFCGLALTGPAVVYLLDRGNSASEIFDALKQATYASIKSLGNERKFQVVLWDNHTGDLSYPPAEPTFATPENLTACMKVLDDVTAFNQSDILSPLKKVVVEAPDEIVIATAKGFELDDSFVNAVQAITKDSKIKIDTISLRGAECPPLKALAKSGGGNYAAVSDGALRAAGSSQ